MRARVNNRITQQQLARMVGKSSAAYIAFIEAGQRNVSVVDLVAIAAHLQTTVSHLIGENDPKAKQKSLIKKLYISDEKGLPIARFTVKY